MNTGAQVLARKAGVMGPNPLNQFSDRSVRFVIPALVFGEKDLASTFEGRKLSHSLDPAKGLAHAIHEGSGLIAGLLRTPLE